MYLGTTTDNHNNLKAGFAEKIINGQQTQLFPLDNRYALIFRSDTAFMYDSHNGALELSHKVQAPACVCKDKNEILWTGTWTGKLLGYNKAENINYDINIAAGNNKQLIIFSIIADPDGSLWAGTFGKGLVHIINPCSENPIIEYYNKKAQGNFFLNTEMILCLHLDVNDNLWIGTNGCGLGTFNKKTQRIETYTTNDGLKSNIIESISSDKNGNIWFASDIISKYDVQKKTFTHYFQPQESKGSFIVKACAKSLKGDLLFGCTEGIYVFDPTAIVDEKDATTPVFTDFRIRGITVKAGDTIEGMVPYSKSIAFSDEIVLPYALNSFSIIFSSLEYNEPNMLNYQYKLDGVDNDWIPSNANNRIANYAGIQPGKYIFQVRASIGSGNWSKPKLLAIRIVPPWWKTIWFNLGLILFIASLITILFIYRIRLIKQQKTILEEKVRKRTLKLSEANILLNESKLVLEMKNEQVEEALNAKDKLLRVIAHDFKNPLSAISGLTVLLKNKFLQFDAKKNTEILNSIAASASNLEIQMSDVLEWALSEKQEIVFKPIEINIEALINDAVELVKKSAERKNLTISLHLDYETNSFVDPRMINTVIRNLLINAIKFTQNDGIITIVVQEFDSEIEVSIIDSGIGISQETIQSILNSDESYSDFDTENIKSTGIGLRLSKHFVEKNGGTLAVRSMKNRGSVFAFTIPRGENKAIVQKQKSSSHKTHNKTQNRTITKDKSITILIIDDDTHILELLKHLFEQYYNVVTAYNGQVGMQLAANVVPALIISDISMPEITGIKVCQALKNDILTSAIPVILITADQQLMNESYASGADDFIVKPFDDDELLLKVHALIENRKKLLTKITSDTDHPYFILPESYDDITMAKLLTYINEHFCESDLDIIKISKEIGLGRTHLWRKFKSSTGQNLSDYIKNLRMTKAKEMLLTGKYKVAEVGYEVGFSNAAYFTKCFSAQFGYTPKECIDRNK
ncbi:MAG: response regulator [Bacteroidales bacterium]|jgi:signal transduction histidine kinase/AraC-like DNA-binding protein|nr:response regulator [Bacteroidales bacterium]